jgi:hypothetical protein
MRKATRTPTKTAAILNHQRDQPPSSSTQAQIRAPPQANTKCPPKNLSRPQTLAPSCSERACDSHRSTTSNRHQGHHTLFQIEGTPRTVVGPRSTHRNGANQRAPTTAIKSSIYSIALQYSNSSSKRSRTVAVHTLPPVTRWSPVTTGKTHGLRQSRCCRVGAPPGRPRVAVSDAIVWCQGGCRKPFPCATEGERERTSVFQSGPPR